MNFMKFESFITVPCGEIGFVEYRRAFCVQGSIVSDRPLPPGVKLSVLLKDRNGNPIRSVSCTGKNRPFLLYADGLTAYDEPLDSGRKMMEAFGFPETAYDPHLAPDETLRLAPLKCWFSDTSFKAVIVSASDVAHGALLDDGLRFTDSEKNPYFCIPEGDYRLSVTFSLEKDVLSSAEKDIRIGRRKDQIICRFHPLSHKEAMIKWCEEMGFSIITDPIPGYLDPYLGVWFRHMGLLKMYRANDICLFEKARVRMFVYRIEEHSTSCETELAWLMANGILGVPGRFFAYRYDIGEPKIGKWKGTPVAFGEDEYLSVCRVDTVNDLASENVFYTDGRAVTDSFPVCPGLSVPSGVRIAFSGVIRPWQMDPSDFVLKDDNTYALGNLPHTIRYTFLSGGSSFSEDRDAFIERIDGETHERALFEFYNIFSLPRSFKGEKISVRLSCFDRKGRETPAKAELTLTVK